MRILLTNDDGVYAEGLRALRDALAAEPGVEVYVVAPDRERSASSHAITLHKPLYVNEVHLPGARCPTWSVNGTPADCTKIGVSALLPSRPDLVVSGINRGANLGTDVLYSGTVSAAIEGVILGIPAIAVSHAAYEAPDYDFAARFVVELVRVIRRRGLGEMTLLNVNLPAVDGEHVAGVAITRLGHRRYQDRFVRRKDPRGRTYYWLAGDPSGEDEDPGTDAGALRHNLVSITPLHLNLTNLSMLERIGDWPEVLEQALNLRGPSGTAPS